jgi:alkanesulfonate monooxygenase SsuD/methylene tetrahydromethanopterin reductase-like flavin-dependent oxidoreductase (luciferase family)
MLGFNIFAADTDAEARLLATSMQQAFVNLRSGRPSALPPPAPGYDAKLPPEARAMLADVLACSAIGSPATVERAIRGFIERTRPDELMMTSQIFDHGARLKSFEIVSDLTRAAPPLRRSSTG